MLGAFRAFADSAALCFLGAKPPDPLPGGLRPPDPPSGSRLRRLAPGARFASLLTWCFSLAALASVAASYPCLTFRRLAGTLAHLRVSRSPAFFPARLCFTSVRLTCGLSFAASPWVRFARSPAGFLFAASCSCLALRCFTLGLVCCLTCGFVVRCVMFLSRLLLLRPGSGSLPDLRFLVRCVSLLSRLSLLHVGRFAASPAVFPGRRARLVCHVEPSLASGARLPRSPAVLVRLASCSGASPFARFVLCCRW